MSFCLAVALLLTLTQDDIERAQKVARASEAERARFHSRYVFATKDATIISMEVVTEFRRVVLVTEDHLRRGDWMFSQSVRAAEEATRDARGKVSIVAQVRFHPLNTYIGVPPFRLAAGLPAASAALAPLETDTSPQYSLAASPNARGSLIGATLTSAIMAAAVGQSVRSLGVLLEGKELTRILVDFRGIE